MKAPIITASALLAIVLFMVLSLVSARSDPTTMPDQLASTQAAEVQS